VTVTVTGTNFTNATRLSLAGALDAARIRRLIYLSPTTLQADFDILRLAAGAYTVNAVNQDGQTSGPGVAFTVS
jgi:hypothetical protein